MARIHTHYDNLKVSRNAPPEVIRAAYKTLSQKFHPDRNPDDPNATRTFQIISRSYEVLSDPLKRRDHDNWIKATEAKEEAEAAARDAARSPSSGGRSGTSPHGMSGMRHAAGGRSSSPGAASASQIFGFPPGGRMRGGTWQPAFDRDRWRRRVWSMQAYVSTARARMHLLHATRVLFCLALVMLIAVALFSDY